MQQEGTFASPSDRADTRSPRGDLFDPACATRDLLDRIGSKWTVLIMLRLSQSGETRFAELRRQAEGISQKMLASTLKSLEQDGLVTRRVDATATPPHVHYSLTTLGTSLTPLLGQLKEWAEENMSLIDTHRARYTRPV